MVNVIGYCFAGCAGARDRIVTALQTYIRATTCVGSKICKDQMRAAMYAAIGTDPCFSRIEFDFDDTLGREDEAYAYLACGHFLVLGEVDLQEAPA
jgi:hypothetical protein